MAPQAGARPRASPPAPPAAAGEEARPQLRVADVEGDPASFLPAVAQPHLLEDGRVLAPVLAHLHEQAQEHLRAQERLDLAGGPRCRWPSASAPPLPMTMPFWLSRSTRIVASMRTSRASSLKDSITTPVRVGDLLAGHAQDLLAHHLGHEEALGLVGQEVVGVERLALRQVREQPLASTSTLSPFRAESGHDLDEVEQVAVLLDDGQDLRLRRCGRSC